MHGFPRVAAYLAQLPQGLDSYPECQVQGGVVRTMRTDIDVRVDPTGLPAPVAALFLQPDAMPEWLPEVHACAMTLAIAEALGSDEAFLAHDKAAQHRFYASVAFRVLTAFVPVQTLLNVSAPRWSALHRGTRLTITTLGSNEAAARIDFPAQLWPPVIGKMIANNFQAGLLTAQTKAVSVSLLDADATHFDFRAAWG